MLRTMLDECMAAIERKTFIPRSRVMAYVHYPPSVYQLHVHFVSPYTLHKDPYRVHSLVRVPTILSLECQLSLESQLTKARAAGIHHQQPDDRSLLLRQVFHPRGHIPPVPPLLRPHGDAPGARLPDGHQVRDPAKKRIQTRSAAFL